MLFLYADFPVNCSQLRSSKSGFKGLCGNLIRVNYSFAFINQKIPSFFFALEYNKVIPFTII